MTKARPHTASNGAFSPIDEVDQSTWGEIADAIATGRAVAFVGAGVSKTVGLSTWKELLEGQIAAAKRNRPERDADIRKIDDLFRQGDLTLTASLLKRLRGLQFTSDLARDFSSRIEPGFAHLAVARLPFAHVITTNYDSLLERAYQPPITDPITYRQPDSILDRIRANKFSLIKLHGHTANPYEAILTEEDFRSIQRSSRLIQCLRILFLTKHVVFIGHSLRDPDLLSLLSDLKQQFSNSGPHYALLGDEVGTPINAAQSFRYYLETYLNISSVVYRYEPTRRVSTFINCLTDLHGRVSAASSSSSICHPAEVSSNQGIEKQLKAILAYSCKLTGSFRGDLAFFNDKKYSGWAITLDRLKLQRSVENARPPDGMSEPGLYVDYSCGPTSRTFTGEPTVGEGPRRHKRPDQAYPDSVIWSAFHGSRDPIVLDDVYDRGKREEKHLDAYRESDTRVTSELAVAIHVGDGKVGVLNLESNIPFAYTDRHIRVSEKLTHQIGYLWDRLIRSDIYRDVTLDPNEMRRTGGIDGKGNNLRVRDAIEKFVPGLSLAQFVADHGKGELVWRPSPDLSQGAEAPPVAEYSFTATSFAAMIFRKGRPLYVPNRRQTKPWVQIDKKIAEKHGVGDELVGVPLFSRGFRVGVLTAWPKSNESRKEALGADRSELIIRTAQLFARTDYLRQISQFRDQHELTFKGCEEFLDLLGSTGTQQDRRAPYDKLMKCIGNMVGVCRVRLFKVEQPFVLGGARSRGGGEDASEFTCLSSMETKRANGFDRNSPVLDEWSKTSHAERTNPRSNPFVEYVIQRAAWSSSAMLMYPNLLNSRSIPRADALGRYRVGGLDDRDGRDPAAKVFGRDSRVGWYVAPITRCTRFGPAESEVDWSTEERTFCGFVAVDNTVDENRDDPIANELPASRTWHELARLKLTWCAAMMGYHLRRL